MTRARRHLLSRRDFCLCCLASASFTATGGWLTPRETFAEARNIVDLIRDDAARAPIKVHKLRRDVSILEGSGGNIAVLTGRDGKSSSMRGSPHRAHDSSRRPIASAAIQSGT